MVALACPCPPASRDLTLSTAVWAAASCSMISSVPVNVIDMAPILTLIWALTDSGPGALEHGRALDARNHPLEVEHGGVHVIERPLGREGVVELYSHCATSFVEFEWVMRRPDYKLRGAIQPGTYHLARQRHAVGVAPSAPAPRPRPATTW